VGNELIKTLIIHAPYTIKDEKAGHSVVEAGSGEECLEKLKAEDPDVILLDVRMPDADGWDVCRRVKADERTRSIPVVMFTVKTSKEAIQKSRECGAEAPNGWGDKV
jgi:CheY-like chemotaxis protein